MSATTLDASALDALPVGAVVVARHHRYGDVAVWIKTDDTDVLDEFGDRRSTAWMSCTYADDRLADRLVAESSAIRLLCANPDEVLT